MVTETVDEGKDGFRGSLGLSGLSAFFDRPWNSQEQRKVQTDIPFTEIGEGGLTFHVLVYNCIEEPGFDSSDTVCQPSSVITGIVADVRRVLSEDVGNISE